MKKAPSASRKLPNDKKPREIEIDGEVYDIPTRHAAAIVEAIVSTWERLGKPEDPFSREGEKLMRVIVATWEDTYPEESRRWYEERKEYQKEELDIRTQVSRQTGRSLASYPYYIYTILRKIFPKVKFGERKTAMKMAKKYPMFKFANKI